MSHVEKRRIMPTVAKSGTAQVLFRVIAIALCVLCLQSLCSCASASKSDEEGIVNHAIKYAKCRLELDMTVSCVVRQLPDAKTEITLLGTEETQDGLKKVTIEPIVVSDTIASWSADEWAANRDDLFFNFVAHFRVICKQANKYGDVPDNYIVTCPDYMVVYDSKKSAGFIVSATGVFHKTGDYENPIGDAIVLTA